MWHASIRNRLGIVLTNFHSEMGQKVTRVQHEASAVSSSSQQNKEKQRALTAQRIPSVQNLRLLNEISIRRQRKIGLKGTFWTILPNPLLFGVAMVSVKNYFNSVLKQVGIFVPIKPPGSRSQKCASWMVRTFI